MRIRIERGLDSRSRAGFWPNDRAGVRAVRTTQGGKNEVRIRFENIKSSCILTTGKLHFKKKKITFYKNYFTSGWCKIEAKIRQDM
jgi:hypothetical protein